MLALCSLVPAACSDSGAAPKGQGAGGGGTAVSVQVAAISAMHLQISATGTVEPSASVQVRSLVDGQLKAILFKEGEHVAAGQTLFQVDDSQIQAQIASARAKAASDAANARQLETEYGRIKDLNAKGYESKAALDKARADADAAEQVTKSDEASVGVLTAQLVHYTITAPIEGRTGENLLQPGATIGAGGTEPLVTINRIAPVRVRFSIPSDNVADARAHFGAGDAKVIALPHGASTQPIEGKLVFLDNAVSDANGQLLAKGEFANTDEVLLPGALVDVTLDLGTAANLVALPEGAVQLGSDKPYVYIVADGDVAQRREVAIAGRSDGQIYLKSGVAAGERVVIDGLARLTDGAKLTIKQPGQPAPGPAAEART